jgi:hypothetical protein
MQTTLLLFSTLTVLISLLSVQIPRYIHHHRTNTDKAQPSPRQDIKDANQRPMTDGADSPPTSRKPWDPPFPTYSSRKGKEREDAWLILPSNSDARNERNDGAGEERVGQHGGRSVDALEIIREKEQFVDKKEAKSLMSIVWTSVAILAGILLTLLFAILIAHCLAWFIVYKTEARLGEARRGLVQGGEMRLCLCARG